MILSTISHLLAAHAKRIVRNVALAALLGVAPLAAGCCCCPIPPAGVSSSSANWHEFVSNEGNFRVMFPTEPTHKTSDDGLEQRYSSTIRLGLVVFRATYELNAPSDVAPVARLEFVADEMGATDVSIRALALPNPPESSSADQGASQQSHPGAEATYTTVEDSQTYHFRHRIYQVGDTAYQFLIVNGDTVRVDEDADRFFSSFELLRGVDP